MAKHNEEQLGWKKDVEIVSISDNINAELSLFVKDKTKGKFLCLEKNNSPNAKLFANKGGCQLESNAKRGERHKHKMTDFSNTC